jgi:hypothetical protein
VAVDKVRFHRFDDICAQVGDDDDDDDDDGGGGGGNGDDLAALVEL